MIAIYGSTWSHFKQTTFYNTTLDSFLQSYNVYKIGHESNISLGPFFSILYNRQLNYTKDNSNLRF